LPKLPSIVNIQALEDCIAWTISFDGTQRFYKEVQHGERFGRLAIEAVFVQVVGQVGCILCWREAAILKPHPEAHCEARLINAGA